MTSPTTAHAGATDESEEVLANRAVPLDAVLVEAALGPMRRFVPDASAAKWAMELARRPRTTTRRLTRFAAELGRIGVGTSTLAPSKRDRRFGDAAWTENPLLKRVLQTYLASEQTLEQLVADADLDWQDERRVAFLAENLMQAAAPSNIPLVNPSSAKALVDTGGANFVKGGMNFVNDMAAPPRVPTMVDTSAFEVGRTLATTPGAVVLRTEQLELIQYPPQAETVRQVPMLVVPPTINKYYALDLAPGRSLVEYLLQNGQQVFMISWRNPDGRHADWGMGTYVAAVLEALGAVERISGSHQTAVTGVCSGGIIASVASAVLTARNEQDRLAALVLLVTVLDNEKAGTARALVDQRLATLAKAGSRRRGYLDGRALAEVFAWLRPGDLVWNYWVNNYLLGQKPPAFDILSWNNDTTRMPAALHADFLDVALENQLVFPGALSVLDTPVDLSSVTVDSYILAGISDHLTPWQNCYRTTQLLGGDSRFVLSTSGHIAALVNPPTNPKATFQVGKENVPDGQEWLQRAETREGSWWPDLLDWLGDRCGSDRPAPKRLGGAGLEPLGAAPGTYVLDT